LKEGLVENRAGLREHQALVRWVNGPLCRPGKDSRPVCVGGLSVQLIWAPWDSYVPCTI